MGSPKKKRGDDSRANKLALALTAAKSELARERGYKRTLSRALAAFAEKSGGEIKITFREIAAAPDLGMAIENEGTRDAIMVFAVPMRSDTTRAAEQAVILGDEVTVRQWAANVAADVEAEPDLVDLEWRGTVTGLAHGTLVLVKLHEVPSPYTFERVVVPRAWVERAAPLGVMEGVELAIADASTRVDTDA